MRTEVGDTVSYVHNARDVATDQNENQLAPISRVRFNSIPAVLTQYNRQVSV